MAGAPHRVAEPERLLLAHRDDLSDPRARRLERIEALARLAHRRLELEGDVEIIDQSRFASAGDEDHLLDAGLARLVDRILDQRPIDDRQQLLGDALGRRQKPSPEAGDREDALADASGHLGAAGPVSLLTT